MGEASGVADVSGVAEASASGVADVAGVADVTGAFVGVAAGVVAIRRSNRSRRSRLCRRACAGAVVACAAGDAKSYQYCHS